MVAAQQATQKGLEPKFFIAADNREAYLSVSKALGPDRVFWTDNRISPPSTNKRGVTPGSANPLPVSSSTSGGSTLFGSAYTELRNRVWAFWPKRSKNPGTDLMAIVDLFLLARYM